MSAEIEGIACFGVGANEAQHYKDYKSSDAEHQLAIHGDPQFLNVAVFPITTCSNRGKGPWRYTAGRAHSIRALLHAFATNSLAT